MPLPAKVQAIKDIAVPNNKRKLIRSFIGIINYYRDMWKRRLDTLTPLTQMILNRLPGNGLKIKNEWIICDSKFSLY